MRDLGREPSDAAAKAAAGSRAEFRIGGVPAHERLLRDLTDIVEEMVSRHQRDLDDYRRLPAEVLRDDVTRVSTDAVRYYVEWLREGRGPSAAEAARLASSAGYRAEEEVPLAAIQSAYLMGIEGIFRRLTAAAEPDDLDAVRDLGSELLRIVREALAVVTEGYVAELRVQVGERNDARRTFLDGLLRDGVAAGRSPGVAPASEYLVLALALGSHPDAEQREVNRTVVERRMIRRLLAVLDNVSHGEALTALDPVGGIVLIPLRTGVDWPWWIESIAKAAQTTGVEVTAAAAVAGAEHVPASAELVGELLDVVRWFGLPPALYRLEDLSVEYQLSRPGPARAALAALLDPLDRHPDLLTTVDAYGATQHNRRRTAGLLHVHPNTVVYRLRRIAELTGIDTATQRGLYQLGAGLAARRAERDTEGDR